MTWVTAILLYELMAIVSSFSMIYHVRGYTILWYILIGQFWLPLSLLGVWAMVEEMDKEKNKDE